MIENIVFVGVGVGLELIAYILLLFGGENKSLFETILHTR